jgi:hypothetical protein
LGVVVPDGNVGIGTDSPSHELEVAGDAGITGTLNIDHIAENTASHMITLDNILLASDAIYLTQTDGNEYIDSLADGYVDIGATTQIRLNQDTKITGALQITGEALPLTWTNGSASAFLYNTGGLAGLGTSTNHDFIFYTNNSGRIRLSADGGVLSPDSDNTMDLGEDGDDRFKDIYQTGDHYIQTDSKGLVLGAGGDAKIQYDGTDLTINPKVVGTGKCSISGALTAHKFIPPRDSQSAQPTPGTGELQVWRDPDDNKTYLIYNDTDEGVRKVEMT